MSRDRQRYRVELDAGLDSAPERELGHSAAREAGDTPFRIAVLGDFTGRANRGVTETGRLLGVRRPVRVDRDDVDAVMARLGPELLLPVGGSASAVRFVELDDFHPDRLFDRLPPFRALREARARAAAPSPTSDVGRRASRSAPGRTAPSGANLLDQILGDVPPPPGGAAAAPARVESSAAARGDSLADFVQRAVAPHVVADATPGQPERVAEVDATTAAELRALLHGPDFQALEAAWRTVDFLVRRLETDSTLQVYLIDVSKAELAADLAGGGEATASGVYRLLLGSLDGGTGGAPWALLVGLFTFGPDSDDVDLLRHLSGAARAAGAPFIAAAHPRVVGCPSFGTAPDPDDWSPADAPDWDALRRTESARYLGLAMPRFLLRLPYGGRDGAPCEVPGFEELSAPDAHEEYLWGNAAALCALLHGEAFASEGWSLRPRLDVSGLPVHLVRAGGDVSAKPCAEAVLGARAVDRIVDRGVMAVESQKDGDAVRLYRIQSVAEPLAPLALRAGSS